MRVKDIIGKEMVHEYYGKVLVTGAKKGSRKYVEVKCIQRKKGWNEELGMYERTMRVAPNRGEGPQAKTIYFDKPTTDRYGEVGTVHINSLTYL